MLAPVFRLQKIHAPSRPPKAGLIKGLPAKAFVEDFRACANKYNAMSIREIREYVEDPKNMIHDIIDGM